MASAKDKKAAAKAMSEGQFGQFPLYAFTTDGVWALEVSATGTYSARQPITRDVCLDSDSITQIDTSVLFATDRGIMQLSGSNSTCISDTIDTEYPFTATTLVGLRAILDKKGLTENDVELQPFRTYIQGGSMIYDYPHQRVLLYNPSYGYAYVYSLKSGMWGMMLCQIKSGVNSYPEALAMGVDAKGNNALLDISSMEVSADPVKGIVITRPLKLELPDAHKTIDTIIQRGRLYIKHAGQILYGSRDLRSWHAVASSVDGYMRGFSGTPYKYYRLVLLPELTQEESVYGLTASVVAKLANRLR